MSGWRAGLNGPKPYGLVRIPIESVGYETQWSRNGFGTRWVRFSNRNSQSAGARGRRVDERRQNKQWRITGAAVWFEYQNNLFMNKLEILLLINFLFGLLSALVWICSHCSCYQIQALWLKPDDQFCTEFVDECRLSVVKLLIKWLNLPLSINLSFWDNW